MTQHLKRFFAVWFVVQIVLPFTAPLQTFDLSDLLGTHPHGSPASPESSTTPTLASEAESAAKSFVSPLAASTLPASTSLAVVCTIALSMQLMSAFGLSPSPQVQQAVIRV